MKALFKQIIIERQEWLQTMLVLHDRDYLVENNANYVFTGLRRAGKSYFLYQIIIAIIQSSGSVDSILFINFEDERLLETNQHDLNTIMEAYYELFDQKPVVFLDEVQNVPHWQKFVRRLADDGLRVFVTGSNADMLSSEIASTLGGRFIEKEILPLSFKEYLNFQEILVDKNIAHSKKRFEVIRAFESYMKYGGFPELLKFENKREFLSSVYQKLFYGDLIARYNISNVNVIKLLVKKIAESVNNETSVNRIKNLIKSTGISIGNNTLFDYLSHLEASFMIASISNYHSKFAEKQTNKKYYFLDTGILNLFLHNQDTKLLENLVYIQLRRKGMTSYFLKRNQEVDFFVPEENLLIQVSYSIANPETLDREVYALSLAMKEFDISIGYIITFNEAQIIDHQNGKIHVIPAWQWLLGS